MSMLITFNNYIMTFKNYLMSESIKPKVSNYGLNIPEFDDMKWQTIHVMTSDEHSVKANITFMKINDLYYCVGVDETGEIFFGVSSKASDNFESYSDSRTNTRNIITVFSSLMYVFLKGIKHINVNIVKFYGANPALGTAYESIIKNKFFIQALEKEGFKYEDKIDEYWIFKKYN